MPGLLIAGFPSDDDRARHQFPNYQMESTDLNQVRPFELVNSQSYSELVGNLATMRDVSFPTQPGSEPRQSAKAVPLG
jgi:hypothetical protein